MRGHHSPTARVYLRHRLAAGDDVVLHVEGHYLINLLPLEARRRALVVEHNIESILFEQQAALTTVARERRRLLLQARSTRRTERAAWRTARMVAAVTTEDASLIKEAVPNTEIRVLPDGADHLSRAKDRRTRGRSNDARLLFVANLAYPPNDDAARVLVNRIFPSVLARCPDATLAIVGPAPPEWLTQSASNEPRITVTGWVPDVAAWLDAAEVVVCPLRIGGGVKVKVLEAIARGRAVITTAVGMQGLQHLPAGAAVVCDDLASIVEKCVALLCSPTARCRQEARAAAAARRLCTWDDAADLLASAWTMLAIPP